MNAGLDLTRFRPIGERIHVRLYDVDERTEGGIILPDICKYNDQEAEVIGIPPGLPVPGHDWRTQIWCDVGDTVMFQKNALHPLTDDMREGVVRHSDLMAILTDDKTYPLNDWVQVSVENWVEKKGAIHIPQLDQHRPHHGRIMAVGPGTIHPETRRPEFTSLKLLPNFKKGNVGDAGKAEKELIGRRVHFVRGREVHECGRLKVDFLLIKAENLVVLEVD